MPPDTTQTVFDWLTHFKDRFDLLSTLLGILGGGGIVGLFGLLFKGVAWLKQWLDHRSLRRRLGATLYTPEDIERAMRYYLRPFCQSVDPAQGSEIREVYASREDLFSAVDRLLNGPAESKYLLLLADSGMGKTSFLLNYLARYLRRWREPFDLHMIPIGIKDADARIQQIKNKADAVLFLDALDEDTLAIVDHRQRILDLCKMTGEFRRVLMTCRTQFFPVAEEEPRRTGVIKLGSVKAGQEAEYIFHKLYLSPFDDKQVQKYLRLRYSLWQWQKRCRAQKAATKIPQLTARPMLLAHIDDLLAREREYAYSFQLYEEMVEAWLTREEGRIEGLRKKPLREFCERLAVELFVQRQKQGAELLPHEAIEPLAQRFGIKLEGWKLYGRALLNRDAEDNFKFAHRSIMEYLFVKRFLELPVAERPELSWTDQMKRFLWEMMQESIKRHKQVQFNFEKADLFNLAATLGMQTLLLRDQPQNVSYEQAHEMIKRFGFFDARENKNGRGVAHLYVPFVRHEQKLVLDFATGLTWQQSGSPNYMIYADAEKYIRDLNAQPFAGYNDWRLPMLEEAMSLMESKKHGELHLDPIFDHQQYWIWTADKESAGWAWFALFSNGYCDRLGFDFGNFVRAVRS